MRRAPDLAKWCRLPLTSAAAKSSSRALRPSAKQAIRELVETAHAVVSREMEARISDMQWKSLPYPIDPHHVTTARAELVAENVLAAVPGTTLGRRNVTVFHLKDTRGRLTAIRYASARKRLLQGRYQGWASGTTKTRGVTGPAAEGVLHASLVAAAPHGYRLVNPDGGEVRNVLGGPVPGGRSTTELSSSRSTWRGCRSRRSSFPSRPRT